MRDQEGAGLKAEALRQLDVVHAPGKHTQVQSDRTRAPVGGSAPGKHTLAESQGGAHLFDGALADAKHHAMALDAALTRGDHAHVEQSIKSLHAALGHVREAVGKNAGGPERFQATIDLIVRAEPLLVRARNTAGVLQRKENGAAQQEGAEHAVSAAGSSTGSQLPDALRGKLEAASGTSMDGVRVHTGSDSETAASAVGAKAYTVGQDIHFGAGQFDPESADGQHLIAHEAAHTVQQRGGTPTRQNKLEVSTPGDQHEVQADRFADAVVHGGATASLSAQSKTIAREALSGNPGELKDAAGKATTTHRPITIADAVNPPPVAAPTTTARPANVKVVATETAPVHFNQPSCPRPESLYTEGAAVSPTPAGFVAVTSFVGTPDQPMVKQTADTGIFIANTPTADDVQQGGIGDCYLQAVALSMANRDPGHIKSMIVSDGKGGATVNLWRRQAHKKTIMEYLNPFSSPPAFEYIPVAVAVTGDLDVNIADNHVRGSQLRAAPTTKSMDYFAKVNGAALEVHRNEVVEVARWAPLLEKAYARFTEQYGMYGGARGSENKAAASGSGYDTINSGNSNNVFPVLYGKDADAAGAQQETAVNAFPPAGGDLMMANRAIVDQLCTMAGRGKTAAPGDKDAPMLEALTNPDAQLNNLVVAIPKAIADAGWAKVSADRQKKILTLQTALTAWQNTPPDTNGATAKATAVSVVGNAAIDAARTPNPISLDQVRKQMPATVQFAANDDTVPAAGQGPLNFFGQWLDYEIASGTLVPFDVTVTGHVAANEDLTKHPQLGQNRADNTNAAIKTGFKDPGRLARNNFNSVNKNKDGADKAPAWRRVDLGVDMQQTPNELLSTTQTAPIRTMMDLVLNVRNLGTDHSSGQRNVYAGHAYAVEQVSFVDAAHAPVPLQSLSGLFRLALFPRVDVDSSTVTLHNPHHGNAPDRDGTNRDTGDGVPSGPTASGVFTMSLAGFFHNFNWVDSTVLPKS